LIEKTGNTKTEVYISAEATWGRNRKGDAKKDFKNVNEKVRKDEHTGKTKLIGLNIKRSKNIGGEIIAITSTLS
jgi:hypothetical protein